MRGTLDKIGYQPKGMTAEEFGRQLKRNGDLAVNFRTGAMFKSIMKGIYRDVKSGFRSGLETGTGESEDLASVGAERNLSNTRR